MHLGSVYFYTTPDNGVTWSERQKLLPFVRAADVFFGRALSLYSDNLIVGAFGDTDKGFNSGAVIDP